MIMVIFWKWVLNIQRDYTNNKYMKNYNNNEESSYIPYQLNKKKYVAHINALKQAINHGLKLKKIYRIIEFNQEVWLKPYINMNTELSKAAKNDFEKDLLKLRNNSVFGKKMENIRKHRDIKLVTTDKKRSKLVSEPNYHTINLISEDLSIIEMKKTKVKTNKPVYLGLSILEINVRILV